MNLVDYRHHFNQQLETLFPKNEIDSFFFILAEEYLNITRLDIALHKELIIDENKLILFNKSLERLIQHEPIQYIIGKTEFFGFPFIVNQHTLIPRPETEELVSWVIEIVNSNNLNNHIKILDIGTGTGCIPISLKKELKNTYISAIDISSDALEVAKRNAELNQVEIAFFNQDISKTESLDDSYDIIISNPPYVRELEKKFMQKNVLKFEPDTALFVEDSNPLIFYKKITQLAKNHMNLNGLLFFEINENLGQETKDMIEEYGFSDVEIKKDIFGKDRMIKAIL